MDTAFCLPRFIFIGIVFDTNTASSFQTEKYLEYFLLHIKKKKKIIKRYLGSSEQQKQSCPTDMYSAKK